MAAKVGVPTGNLVGGNSVRSGGILQSYVFQSGIHEPEVSNILSWKYPQYYMTSLLDRIGATEAIEQDTWSWFTLDRTRMSGTVSNILEGDGTAWDPGTSVDARIEVAEFVYSGTNLGYALVGDVFRTTGGALIRVTAIGQGATDTDAQLLTVAKVDGSAITAAELSDGDVIGHVFTSFEEASSAPGTRLYLPTEEYGQLQIMRRSFEVSGTEFTNRTYLADGKSWYFTKEAIEMKEFARDKEGLVVFGQLSTNGTHKTTRGILDYVISDGINNGFVGATGVSETDIQDHIKDMLIEGSSNELLVLCGAQFMADFQRAMRDYAVNGGITFGGFGGNTAGLDFQAYKFMGKTMKVVYYELFDDTAMVPFVGTASSTDINFSNFSLWLDLGSDASGKKLISLKYKSHQGNSRQFIHAYEPGMMNPEGANGGMVSNGKDSFLIHYLCELGVEVRLANRMGILRATS